MIDKFVLDEIILNALKEDIGAGDITTVSTVPDGRPASGSFWAKKDGVICGLPVLVHVFQLIDENVKVTLKVDEGDKVKAGDVIATIKGSSRSILSGERVSLNLLQHMSGIATSTAAAVEAVKGTAAKIADTRKTTPGLRVLEKYAVRVGGGTNHRFNLADGVLIKDNHIVAAGGIKAAVEAARARAPHTLKIEVEVKTMAQIDEALQVGADIIMLDNMDYQQMTDAVKHIAGKAVVEASGNMGDKDLAQVAATGVNLISIGALTHTVRALDISLDFK